MSDKKSNFSLDDILNDIKREREIKAGIAVPEETKREPEPVIPESQGHPYDTVDSLVSTYLSAEEIEQSRRDAELQRTRFVAEPIKPAPAATQEPEEEEEVEQLQLDGFPEESPPALVSEEAEEQELLRRRRKRINDFRMFTESMQDESLLDMERREERQGKARAGIFEHVQPKDGEGLFDAVDEVDGRRKRRPSVRFTLAESPAETAERKALEESRSRVAFNAKAQKKKLTATEKQSSLSSLLSGCVFGVLLILAVIPKFYTQGGALEGFLGGTGRIYLGVNLALIALATAVSFDVVRSSVKSIINLSPNSDTCVLVVLFFATLHNLALLIDGGFISNGGVLYNCAAAFALLLNCLMKLTGAKRMLGNLNTLVKSPSLRSVQTVENRADANQLAYGLSIDGRPGILYSTEAQLPDRFTELSRGRKGEEHFFSYAIPVILVLGVIAGIIGAVSTKNVIGFITSYTGCLCICLPVGITLISNILMLRTNSSLNRGGSVILGFDGVGDFENANAVIMDARDIFYAEVSNFHNVKTYYSMSVEDAVTYAGAVLTKGQGVLAGVFREIVEQQKISVPAVEDLKYEDRLGYSAWVNAVKVLVGNRDMMTQHNVELPPLTPEENAADDGRTTLYVAVEEKLAAAFNVTYYIGKNAAKQIARISKNGIILMLMTSDPGITEEFVAKRTKVSVDAIKVTNSKCKDIMKMYQGTGPRKKDSCLMYKPSQGAMLKVINSAYRLIDADRQAFLIQIIGLIFAAGLCFAVNLLGTSYLVSSITIIVYQLIWGSVACLISGRTLKKY